MIAIGLNIACSVAIYLIFRQIPRWKVGLMQVLTVNYLTAALWGLLYAALRGETTQGLWQPYTWKALLLGVVFITIFRLMALSTQKAGVGATAVASKLSMVLPVALLWWWIEDGQPSAAIYAGMLCGIASVWLTAGKGDGAPKGKQLLLPFAVFAGSAFIDLMLAMAQEFILPSAFDTRLFTGYTFAGAAVCGTLFLVVADRRKLTGMEWLSGSVLGTVNFGSLYFLLEAYRQDFLAKAVVLPVSNVGVVMLSFVMGWLLYNEGMNLRRALGVALALCAIGLLVYTGKG